MTDGAVNTSKGADGGVGPDIEECSWSDVLDSIDEASKSYKSKEEGNKFRSIQRNKALAVTLHSLSDMIPDQDGLSILRGGLKTIFKFIEKRIENGERILAAFEDIPITFSNACNALRAYPESDALRSFVEGLFDVLKTEIPNLIEILLRKQKDSFPKRLFKQHPENEGSSIDRSLELVTRASEKVTAQINILGAQTVVATLEKTVMITQEMSKTQDEISKLSDGLAALKDHQNELERNAMRYYDRQDELTHSFVEKISQSLSQSIETYEQHFRTGFSGIQESLHGLLWSDQRAVPSNNISQTAAGQQRAPVHLFYPPSGTSVPVSYDQIFMMLRLPDSYFSAQDLGLILRTSGSINQVALARATWLLQADRFVKWAHIHTNSSDLILVEGHLGDQCVGKISPLSVLSATFASMNKIPSFLVLSHYCGLHTNSSSPMSGPRGILLSLIAQLVLHQRQSQGGRILFFSEYSLFAITHHSLEAMCHLFQNLVSLVHPGVTIYCVIDNISEFETSLQGWQDELSWVVDLLQFMTLQPSQGPTLKVLLTASNRSIKVFHSIDAKNRVSLSAGNEIPWSTVTLSVQDGWHKAMNSR